MNFPRKGRAAVVALLIWLPPAAVLGHQGHEHFAPHGGVITAAKDGHCETVLLPKGGVRVYLTDAASRDLPATLASDVSVEIEGGDKKTDTVPMTISAGGDFWEGPYKPVTDAKGIVHLAFVLQGEPVVVDLPVLKLVAAHLAAVKAAAEEEEEGNDHHGHGHTDHSKTDQHEH
jgi:hypothetical protein